MPKLVDALVVLLIKLHLSGFFWGDCSLSNTLFRRSAGEFAAYLVDAETGELHRELSNGQRAHDLEIATQNIFAEILDLQAGGMMSADVDAYDIATGVAPRYGGLWSELTSTENFSLDEMWRIEQRISRLNELGFDVDELDIVTDWDGATVRVQPKVVDAGHHQRRLQGLTGLDVEENQARRLLNDLDAFTAHNDLQREDPAMVAHRWLTEIYLPVAGIVPEEKRGDLDPAELFHEILEHRWYLSERARPRGEHLRHGEGLCRKECQRCGRRDHGTAGPAGRPGAGRPGAGRPGAGSSQTGGEDRAAGFAR